MSWHLKNEQLEHELNKSSHPMHTFTDELNKKMIQIQKKRLTGVHGVEITFQRLGTGGVILENNLLKFSIEEIKEVPEYNPHGWNKYPEVDPPGGVPMRVETNMGFGFKARFELGYWRDNRNDIVGLGVGDVIRFRPWEG